jgi:ribulose-5-phosphate 4-epimerase/fuculose-1-phosphate aldolase
MSASPQVGAMHAEAQRRARIDLAACHRLAVHFGFHEGIDNHMTMLVPGSTDRFYLAPFGLLWSEVKASELLEVGLDGRLLAGRGLIEDTALCIHAPVHRLAPRARCVLHTHMPYATALGMLAGGRLETASQTAIGFHDDVVYADYNGLALDFAEGERMARALGTKSVLMLRNHGVLVIGESLAEAFERLYFLERAAQVQVLALSTGRPLAILPEPVVRATLGQFAGCASVGGENRAHLHFEALKRLLDRQQADYAS